MIALWTLIVALWLAVACVVWRLLLRESSHVTRETREYRKAQAQLEASRDWIARSRQEVGRGREATR